MRKRKPGEVSTSDVRELDRAMTLLQRGRISYGRWVETVAAWCAGEDIAKWDYGDAESAPERILRLWRGAVVTTSFVHRELGVDMSRASISLTRLARRGLARRLRRGEWLIGNEERKP